MLNPPRTPAARHLAAKLARLGQAADPHGGTAAETSGYQLMQAQLAEHRRVLKSIQSIENKILYKAKVLPEYDPWVDAVLSLGKGAQDVVLTTVMVWHIDSGNYARAWEIAQYVLRHNLDMPDQYERTLPTILQEEFADAFLGGKMPVTLDSAALLAQVLEATKDADTFDQVKAKLHKAIAFCFLGKNTNAQQADLDALDLDTCTQAFELLVRANQLDDKVGVKKDIERLNSRLKKLAAAQHASETTPATTATPDPGDSPPAAA